MKKTIRNIANLLLVLSLLPLTCGCLNNEDDVIEIFVGKTWKLTRLTTKGSSARFLPGLWNDEATYNQSMERLDAASNYVLNFEGIELNGELTNASVNGRAINRTLDGTWQVDGVKKTLTISVKGAGAAETDPLAKEFINGLGKVSRYDGDSQSLTLFYEEGSVTKVMGFKAQ